MAGLSASTKPTRTAFDLGRWLPVTEAVQRIDALIAATNVKVIEIEEVAHLHCVRAAAATHLCRFRGHIRRVADETAQPR